MRNGNIRILMAKPGLDGHDRGIKVVSLALRDAGFQVIYLGRRNNSRKIVDAAIQEDVDFIGLSVLSGSHVPLVKKIMDIILEKKLDNIKVLLGGTIPDRDIPVLQEMGVAGVFPTGSDLDEIIAFVKNEYAGKTPA